MPWFALNSKSTSIFISAVLLSAALPLQAVELPLASVVKRQLPIERILDGQMEAVHQATVSSQTSGRVTKIYVDVGDYVSKGQVLAKLKPLNFEIEVQKCKIALELASLASDDAQKHFERMKALWEKESPAIPKHQYDGAESQAKQASLHLRQARLNLKQAKPNAVSGFDVEQSARLMLSILKGGEDEDSSRLQMVLANAAAAIFTMKEILTAACTTDPALFAMELELGSIIIKQFADETREFSK